MYWQEDEQQNEFTLPDDVVDVSFRIRCRRLPVDHAYALSRSVLEYLPWLEQEAQAGLHLIYGAETGNGWSRPEDQPGELLHLPRRTRFTLRVPKARVVDAKSLCGKHLLIDDCHIAVGEATVKPLSMLTTVFARHVVTGEDEDENAFSRRIAEALRAIRVHARKMLCGRIRSLHTPEQEIPTRSVMLADLSLDESIRLQQQGLGPLRHMGCGMFIPHKGINAVAKASEEG